MTQTIYILTLALGLSGCNNTANHHSEFKSKNPLENNIKRDTSDHTNKASKVYFSDSLFSNLELKLNAISSSQYKAFEKKYKTSCPLDTNGFIKGKGLVFSNYCKDICESYLIDKNAGVKLVLPSGYDGGIIGLLVSPSCNQFIVYSSYDRPDYMEYYDYRAEIFCFTITPGQGFKTIKPSFKYFTKDWSINQITWIDDNTLALRLYNGESYGNQESLNQSYFQANLTTK